MGIGSLVVGIIALCLMFGGKLGLVGVVLAIIGIILGAQGKKIPDQRGVATAGLVISIIALVLDLIVAISCFACAAAASCAFNDIFGR